MQMENLSLYGRTGGRHPAQGGGMPMYPQTNHHVSPTKQDISIEFPSINSEKVVICTTNGFSPSLFLFF